VNFRFKIAFGVLLFSQILRAAPSPAAVRFNFDDLKVGSLSSGWSSGYYGPKGDPKWLIEPSANAPSQSNILTQRGRATYAWLVHDSSKIKDGFVEAQFKIVSGKEDPEAGLVWRHQDGQNYFYVRGNSVENNVVFYRMRDGKKELVKTVDVKVPGNTWHKLRIEFSDSLFKVLLNGKSIMTVVDKNFKSAGKVGLFTTADTIASFDDFQYGGK
jgi:hypothetical protein